MLHALHVSSSIPIFVFNVFLLSRGTNIIRRKTMPNYFAEVFFFLLDSLTIDFKSICLKGKLKCLALIA